MSQATTANANRAQVDFQLHTVDTAPEGSRSALELSLNQVGFVSNIWAVMAESPATLNGYASLIAALNQQGTLSAAERILVHLAVSRENECKFCVPFFTYYAPQVGLDVAVAEAARNREPIADPRLSTLRDFSVALVQKRGKVSQEKVQAFFDAGFTKAHLLEILGCIAAKTITNYLTQITDIPLNDDWAEYAWDPDPA